MEFISVEFSQFIDSHGAIALVSDKNEEIDALDAATNGQLKKALKDYDGKSWLELKSPSGIPADRLYFAHPSSTMRKLGGELAHMTKDEVVIWGADYELAFGFALRNYRFDHYKTEKKPLSSAQMVVPNSKQAEAEFGAFKARAEGVHLTRNLVNEPANVLTTTEFASRIQELKALGVEVEILDEAQLEKIGMRALLGVGQGSNNPSLVAIMKWQNGKGDPLALVGKGVVFDTGGISIKPAAGMEAMIMDMGGAATVVGTMRAIAARGSKSNVIGIVGLVENMPDANAQRPGDIVKTLKGDTVEVLNTDAEGRLVLADILWYVQEQYKPKAIIDLATLTGAIIMALGDSKAGVFGNDDEFTTAFLAAAKQQGEGAWSMPMGEQYDQELKSKHADIGNIGGRQGGAIIAAQFLQRFVKEGTPWIHLDIAGVAWASKSNEFSTDGGTGWGVLSLDQLITDHFES